MSAVPLPDTDSGGGPNKQPWWPPRLIRLDLPDTEAGPVGAGIDIVWS
jgi:hypothetical protein